MAAGQPPLWRAPGGRRLAVTDPWPVKDHVALWPTADGIYAECGAVAIQQASAACCGAGGAGLLSGRFECGRHPGVAIEQVAERAELADAPFGGGGQVGLDEREVSESLDGAPASS